MYLLNYSLSEVNPFVDCFTYGMWRRVALYVVANVSGEHTASIFRFPRNDDYHLQRIKTQ